MFLLIAGCDNHQIVPHKIALAKLIAMEQQQRLSTGQQ
jgi:hypothetical protein